LVSLIRNSLRGAAAFSDVMESGGALKANTLIEISVSQLMETFANRNIPPPSWRCDSYFWTRLAGFRRRSSSSKTILAVFYCEDELPPR